MGTWRTKLCKRLDVFVLKKTDQIAAISARTHKICVMITETDRRNKKNFDGITVRERRGGSIVCEIVCFIARYHRRESKTFKNGVRAKSSNPTDGATNALWFSTTIVNRGGGGRRQNGKIFK